MSDTVTRFSNRVENYAKYRPSYPPGVLDLLQAECGLTENLVVADIGSGTGILTELFLRNGNRVFGIEPNSGMRAFTESALKHYPGFESREGSAEATGLEADSVDLITAAQAFHWFDREKSKREFSRILRPEGWVVIIFNARRLDSTPFLRDYEHLLLRYGTDYDRVRHENVEGEIAGFFAPNSCKLKTLENFQSFDFGSLKGRLLSASYTPAPDHADFEAMLAALGEIFRQHERDGTVTVEYETRIFYGHFSNGQ